jgi:flagellar motor switch protein FliM
VQIVPPGETVIVISFQLKMLQSSGLMTICYPYVALEGTIGKLSAQNWIDATKRKSLTHDTDVNRANLLTVPIPVSAVLTNAEVRIRDFLNMNIGDVITTDKKIMQEMEVSVRGRQKFLARPGLVGKKRGFIITQVFDEPGKE